MKPLKTATACRLGSRVVLLLLLVTLFSATANAQTVTLGEAVDNTSLTWTTGGDANWFGQTSVYYYDGDAAQSGDVTGGQSSWIETTVTGPGILSFYWKVSSSSAWNDLVFYIDEVEKVRCWADEEWERKAYSIPSGSHTLRWDYAPFLSGYAGFLDKVVFTSGPVIMVESPNGGETWQHRNFYSIRWLSTEDVGPNVKIELYKGGSLSYTISASTDNDGFYSWFVLAALKPGTDYRIKITSTSSSSIYDYSDSYFSIAESFQSSFGGSLILDGVDDYAEAEDQTELDVGDEEGESLTIEAWVNFRTFGNAEIATKFASGDSAYGLYTEYRYQYPYTYKCLVGELWWQGGGTQLSSCTTQYGGGFWVAGWHHVALVLDRSSGQASTYMDGEREVGPSDVLALLRNSAAPLKVGVTLNGVVDEVRISDVARYTGSTYTLPTSPFTCDEHTRALWHFDECEGETLFHDVCGAVDNLLVGYNGAHTEGALCVYLPLILKGY